MKGIVLSFSRPKRFTGLNRKISVPDFRYIIKRYGVKLLFTLMILLGMILGALYARSAQSEALNSLDFLFTTNLEARLSQSAIGTFCACFASDFIFLISIYLFGTAPWGLPFQFAAVMFKGFGTGITAAYLFITHGLSGAGFYLLVLLPGTFLFCIALAVFSSYAFEFSKRMFLLTVGKSAPLSSLREGFLHLSSKLLTAMIFTFASALLDTLLWSLFAGAFKF